jgi:hypothetical protein
MANNVQVTAGTGTTFKTTDTGGVHVPHHNVDTLPALPAGTNNIGDVDIASIAAGDNNIGNVDIVTMPNVTLAAGTNTNEVVGDAAHDAAAAGNPLLMGGVASAAAPADVSADGDAVRAWRLRNGAAATVVTAAGALIGGDATNGLDVDVTRVIPGTSATHLGKAEDAAHAGGDTGVLGLAVRRDADTTSVDTDGDYAALLVDAVGALKVRGRLSATIAPTMGTQTNGAYSANDFVDGKLTLSNAVPIAGGSGLIHRVSVLSKSTQTGQYDVIFFNADPSSTTIADNGAVQVNVADLAKVIGVAKCNDVASFGTGSLHQAVGLGLSFKLASGTTLYAAVVTRAAITQTSTSDMILLVNVIPD